MKPLAHTGDSSNIAYYAEFDNGRACRDRGDIWAEVLRSGLKRLKGTRTLVRVPPTFYVRVYRIGAGEITRKKYKPRKPVPPGRLDDKTVTRLVREALKEGQR
jgi:hypothetical protein